MMMSDPQIDFSHLLRRFPIFAGLDDNALRLIRVDEQLTFRAGETIFQQGDPIQYIYLILSGSVKLEHRSRAGDLQLTQHLTPNQTLGRLELDTPEGQLGTATALTLTRLIAIDKRTLAQLRAQFPSLADQFDRSEVIGHLRASPYLSHLSDIEVKWLSDIVLIRHYKQGDVLFRQGQPGHSLWLIRQGRVCIQWPQGGKQWLSAGAVFGQRSAITGRRRRATAFCDSQCHLYEIPAETLRDIARQHRQNLDEFLARPIDVPAILAKTPLFQNLTPEETAHLAGYTMQLHYNRSHRTVVRKNKNDDYYYVLVKGYAVATRQDPQTGQSSPYPLTPGAAFGEAGVLLGDPAAETVETTSPTDWLRIHRQDFALFLEAHPSAQERLFLPYDVQVRLEKARKIWPWQEDGEVILCQRRRHIIVLLRRMIFWLAFLLAFVIIIALIDWVVASPPVWAQLVLIIVVFLASFAALAWIVIDYRNDYHIVTSRRVAHVEKVVLFTDKRLSAPLDKIQDLQISRTFWARFLGYGHLTIATAAEEGHILFDYLPGADEVYELLIQEMDRAKIGSMADNEEIIRQELQDRLHLGLEERLDRRALLETYTSEALRPSLTSRLPFNRLLGLQQEKGNRWVWRKHWLGLLVSISWSLLVVLFLVFVILFLIGNIFLKIIEVPVMGYIVVFPLVFVLLAVFMSLLWWRWTDWRNDLYIVTDQRIEHIERKPLWFDDDRMVLSLERVQNVEYRKRGPVAHLLNYGDVIIQTAAAEGRVVFRFVPEPDQVQAIIFHRIETYRLNQATQRQKRQKSDFSDWLAAYHQIVQEERERLSS